MRKWLESYEQGKSEASIGKDAHRDVRTVKKGIDQARQEREVRMARAELLTDALKRHQNDLSEVINKLQSAMVVPAYNLELRADVYITPVPIPLPGATVTYGTEQEKMVSLHIESDPAHELLQEHLRGDPLWKSIAQWKKAVATDIMARFVLKAKIKNLLEENTGLLVVRNIGKAPDTGYIDPFAVDLFYQVVYNRALGVPDETNPEERIIATSDGYVQHGQAGSRLAYAPDFSEKCKDSIIQVLRDAQLSPEAIQAKNAYKLVEELTPKAKRALDDLYLLRWVPGQCRVCRRLGV